jgi:hypothetical protein
MGVESCCAAWAWLCTVALQDCDALIVLRKQAGVTECCVGKFGWDEQPRQCAVDANPSSAGNRRRIVLCTLGLVF